VLSDDLPVAGDERRGTTVEADDLDHLHSR
jgi:hypothetical protein